MKKQKLYEVLVLTEVSLSRRSRLKYKKIYTYYIEAYSEGEAVDKIVLFYQLQIKMHDRFPIKVMVYRTLDGTLIIPERDI